MTPEEAHLKQLAVGISETHRGKASRAGKLLPRAQQLLFKIRQKRQAIVFPAAYGAPAVSASDAQPESDKELTDAVTTVANLELKLDYAETTRLRARDYVPIDELGGYTCPQCWVQEHWSLAIQPLLKIRELDVYECPACGYRFALGSCVPLSFRTRLIRRPVVVGLDSAIA